MHMAFRESGNRIPKNRIRTASVVVSHSGNEKRQTDRQTETETETETETDLLGAVKMESLVDGAFDYSLVDQALDVLGVAPV